MSRNNPKSNSSAANDSPSPAQKRESPVSTNLSGRVKHDDRGNAVWEWAVSTSALTAESPTQQGLKKLDNSSLSLAEDAPSPMDVMQQNPLGTVKGYSPYDSGLLAKKKDGSHKKKDLRKLSEWLKLKKQADANKSED